CFRERSRKHGRKAKGSWRAAQTRRRALRKTASEYRERLGAFDRDPRKRRRQCDAEHGADELLAVQTAIVKIGMPAGSRAAFGDETDELRVANDRRVDATVVH